MPAEKKSSARPQPSGVSRFGVSMSAGLLERFDRLIARKGYANRSEAIRDMVRDRLVDEEWEHGDREVVGTLTLIYDHDALTLISRLMDLQHEMHSRVISTLHVHLDAHHCLETMVLRGSADAIRETAEKIVSLKGVKHGKLAATSIGEHLT